MILHVGQMVEKVFRSLEKEKPGCAVTWFAGQLNCDRRNIYDIFKRSTIDTQLLVQISLVLDHNFYDDIAQDIEEEFNDHSGSQDISSNTSGSNHSGTIVLTTEEIRIDASLGYNYVYELHPDGSAMVHEYTYGYEYGDEKHEYPKKLASNPDRHYEGEWSTFNRQKGNSYQKVYRVDYDGEHRFIPEDFKYSYSDIHEMNSHNTKSAIKIKSVNK